MLLLFLRTCKVSVDSGLFPVADESKLSPLCAQARRNREIAILQRKIDEVPSRAELTQYQKRFLELYSQGRSDPPCTQTGAKTRCDSLRFCVQFLQRTKRRSSSSHCTTRWTTRRFIWRRRSVNTEPRGRDHKRTEQRTVCFSAGQSAELHPRQLPAVSRTLTC